MNNHHIAVMNEMILTFSSNVLSGVAGVVVRGLCKFVTLAAAEEADDSLRAGLGGISDNQRQCILEERGHIT